MRYCPNLYWGFNGDIDEAIMLQIRALTMVLESIKKSEDQDGQVESFLSGQISALYWVGRHKRKINEIKQQENEYKSKIKRRKKKVK